MHPAVIPKPRPRRTLAMQDPCPTCGRLATWTYTDGGVKQEPPRIECGWCEKAMTLGERVRGRVQEMVGRG